MAFQQYIQINVHYNANFKFHQEWAMVNLNRHLSPKHYIKVS